MADEQSICMPLYLPAFTQDWGTKSIAVAEEVAKILDIDFTHFLISHTLGRNAPLRDRQDYQWNEKNQARLEALLNLTSPFGISWLVLTKGTKDSPISIGFTDKYADGYGMVYFECTVKSSVLSGNPSDDFSKYLKMLACVQQMSVPKYGFVMQMQTDSWPGFYFATDSRVPNMTPEQAADLKMWSVRRNEYGQKVRGVYWGNLLSGGHLTELGGINTFSRNITAIVGSDLVAKLTEDTVFFMLPDLSESRIAVEQLLNKGNLLMRPQSS